MANKIMKSLTIGENTYEIYDEVARNDIETLKQSTIETDDTLTVSGAAADAKAVGDAISDKVSKSGDTMTGILTTKGLTIHNADTNYPSLTFQAQDATNRSILIQPNLSDGVRQFAIYQYPSDSDDTETRYYEAYKLPTTPDGLTANGLYNILTTKNPVTIAQGGTGGTSQTDALKNICNITVGSPASAALTYPNMSSTGYVDASCTTDEYVMAMPAYREVTFMHSNDLSVRITDAPTNYGLMTLRKGANNNYINGWFVATTGQVYVYKYHSASTGTNGWKRIYTANDAVPITSGGTGATTLKEAQTNLGIATVGVGIEIPSNSDLNDYTTVGVYRSTSGSISATLTNTPYTTTGFRMEVFNTTSVNQIMQEIKCNAGSARTYRRQASYSNSVWTFGSWYKVLQTASENEALAIGDGGTGGTTPDDACWNLGAFRNTTTSDAYYMNGGSGSNSAWISYLKDGSALNQMDLWSTYTSFKQPVDIASGGTGATTAATARTNLGVPPTSHASTATTYGVSSASNYGHAMASSTTPKALGTAAVGSETAKFARGDHVHALPALTSCTGTLTVAKGGTGATTAKAALENLGIVYSSSQPTGVAGKIWLKPV